MSRLTRRLNDYQDELGIKIEGRAFHGIRKMFTERMIDAGASIYDLKDLMRHREIRTTMEHYKRKRMDQLKEKLEMMEKLNSTEIPQKSLESLESLKSLETEKQKIEG
jgi:integrase